MRPLAASQDYLAEMNKWLAEDWRIDAIVDTKTDRAAGLASYMRVEPGAGSIEVGHYVLAPPSAYFGRNGGDVPDDEASL
jgi:hypothetical protein